LNWSFSGRAALFLFIEDAVPGLDPLDRAGASVFKCRFVQFLFIFYLVDIAVLLPFLNRLLFAVDFEKRRIPKPVQQVELVQLSVCHTGEP
jgi:hypothetical protein